VSLIRTGRADGRYEFPAEWLNQEEMNVFEFILPYNSSGGDSNFRNYSVSVMRVLLNKIWEVDT
jgi:hypothetical protein